MKCLALDQSKSSTGWACWQTGWEKPVFGHICLGSSYTWNGGVYTKLRSTIFDLWATVTAYEFVFHEAAIAHNLVQGTSTANKVLALGLVAAIEGAADELGLRKQHVFAYESRSWRPDFIGRDVNHDIKAAAKRAEKTARDPLKAAVKERCRQLGIAVTNDDEGDAVGILTYGILGRGLTPPWLEGEVLRPILGGSK